MLISARRPFETSRLSGHDADLYDRRLILVCGLPKYKYLFWALSSPLPPILADLKAPSSEETPGFARLPPLPLFFPQYVFFGDGQALRFPLFAFFLFLL